VSGARRKIQRAKKKRAEKEMQEKVFLFDKLEDECLTCKKAFDKKDEQQVKEWSVVVRKKEGKVNLYCPECWTRAKNIIKEVTRRRDDN